MHNMTITKRGSFTVYKSEQHGCGAAPVGSQVKIDYDVLVDVQGKLNKRTDQFFDHKMIAEHFYYSYEGEHNSRSLERLCIESTDTLKRIIERYGLTVNQLRVKLSPKTNQDAGDHYVDAENVYTREGWTPPPRAEVAKDDDAGFAKPGHANMDAVRDDEQNHASAEA